MRPLIALVAFGALLGPAAAAPRPGQATPSVDALYAQASAAYRGARYHEAARLFRDLMVLDPGDPALKFYLADSLSRIGRHEAARDRLLEFFVAVATDRAVPLSEYKPEVDAAPALMDRLVLVESPAERDDSATVFAGIAVGTGVAAAGLLVGALVVGARADQAETEYVAKREASSSGPEACDTDFDPNAFAEDVDCSVQGAAKEINRHRDSMVETRGAADGLLLAAAGVAAISLGSLLTWAALRDGDGPALEITPSATVGRSLGAGVSLMGTF